MDWINKQIIFNNMDQLKRRWGPPKIMNERKIMNYIQKKKNFKYPAITLGINCQCIYIVCTSAY